ncbi:GNAT family N-acetyltransferase [Blastomonas sp.]|uniref:GNAT family N-acetyltransferase n=1 Tax=Blastomonas sp. TaxID=1909299 RepID=UPI002618FC3A|nr:GNAT family N-acetyltransferase [Blastomonas sp.]MDM7957322.1 GNAT family N-acetyltransferase [Blastomonas sp.]
MQPVASPIRFLLGDRQVLAPRRMLVPIAYGLDAILANAPLPAPRLPADADGYRLQSVPVSLLARPGPAFAGLIASPPQLYARHYIDMAIGHDGYLAQFSSKTRATLKRKLRKLAEANGGALDIRSYHRPDQVGAFFDAALPLSAQTYQARLLDAGLPGHEAFRAEALRLAEADNLRAYVLFLHGKAAAYLYLPVAGDVLIYAYLGYDQAIASLSPGTVLQMHALEALFAERRFRYFDFTEGDGAHKALFGTHQVPCATVFLLKPTLPNRALLTAQQGFNAAVEGTGTWLESIGAKAKIRKLLRG